MRVVHVIIGLGVGGAESMLYRLVTAGGDSDEHCVISLGELGVIGQRLSASGVRVCALGLKSAIDVPRVLFSLAAVMRSIQPDVVQTWMYHADLLGGAVAKYLKLPVVWGVRRTDVGIGVSYMTRLLQNISGFASRFIPDAIVAPAQASRASHIKIGYSAKRFVVIPNGFDFNSEVPYDLSGLRRKFGCSESDVLIGSVGRFNEAKNHVCFVEACVQVAKQFDGVRFLLAGKDVDSSNRSLMELLVESGVEERFHFLGHFDDPSMLYRMLDVFVLHSVSEGFPNVLVEAMGYDVFCISTDVGDAVDILDGSGVVVEGFDSKALAGALIKALSLPLNYRIDLGRRGGLSARRRFSIQVSRRRFHSLYCDLVSGRSRR